MQLSRRSMLVMTTSVLAMGCTQQDAEVSAAASEPATAPSSVPASGLSEEDLDLLASAFEADPEWNLEDGTVAPINVVLVRNDLRKAINDSWAEVVANPNKYFKWANDEDSFDYFHLVSMGQAITNGEREIPTSEEGAEFELTADVLKRMAAANFFELTPDPALEPGERRIIFGLRGCQIISGDQSFSQRVRLRDVRPDHRQRRCVIGVWNPNTDEVAAFEGSTVPLELHQAIFQQWVSGGKSVKGKWRACMVPQGLHRRQVGLMFGDRALSGQWPLTLRQDPSPVPVLRSPEGDAFTWVKGDIVEEDGRVRQAASQWDPMRPSERVSSVGAHIHAAAYAGSDLQYSSQGCQTIEGNFRNGKASGQYARFHEAMGFGALTEETLERADGTSTTAYRSDKDGRSYPFMLLTGAEARLHSLNADIRALQRVRIGSSAPGGSGADHIVNQLKRLIGGDVNAPAITPADMLRLVERQTALSFEGLAPDGILAPHQAEIFGDLRFP